MTDDLLKRASAALREETADATDGARFTRARVMASLQQSQVRRRSRLAVLLPLAACFAAASAFGMVNGRVPALVRSVTESLGFGTAPSEAPSPPTRKKSNPKQPAATKAPSTVLRIRAGNRLANSAAPADPYAASPRPTSPRASSRSR